MKTKNANTGILQEVLPVLILTAIAVCCVLLLAFTSEVTQDARDKQIRQEKQAKLVKAYPEAEEFLIDEPQSAGKNLKLNKIVDLSKDFPHITAVAGALKAGKLDGYVVSVESPGYKGEPVFINVSFDLACQVKSVQPDASKQTQGVGSKIEDPTYLQQFIGISATQKIALKSSSGDSEKQVDAVTGATVSSKSLITGINEAFAAIVKVVGK